MNTAATEKQNPPQFSLDECLDQLFGESIPDEDEIPFINTHEDGYYDSSLSYYLPFINHGFIQFWQVSHGKNIFDRTALDYIREIGLSEGWERKSMLPQIREKLRYLAWKISLKPLQSAEQLKNFYREIYSLWKNSILRDAEIRWFHTYWSHHAINIGKILAEWDKEW